MNFEEFARDSGKALAEAASRLPTPSLAETSSRASRCCSRSRSSQSRRSGGPTGYLLLDGNDDEG